MQNIITYSVKFKSNAISGSESESNTNEDLNSLGNKTFITLHSKCKPPSLYFYFLLIHPNLLCPTNVSH
jgi:hypothetical protein